ncbi:trp operon leader peptide [Salmonella enterica]|nr:trp operon leader peptide [Salmonella enterica]
MAATFELHGWWRTS